MKLTYVCSGCGKRFRRLQLVEGKQLCYFCRSKKHHFMRHLPIKFDDVLKRRSSVYISLTNAQNNLFNKRLKGLGIGRTEYCRTLILHDLEEYQEEKKKQRGGR